MYGGGGVEILLHALLALPPGGGDWSASHPSVPGADVGPPVEKWIWGPNLTRVPEGRAVQEFTLRVSLMQNLKHNQT